jgi:hypothetical protein
MFNNLWEEIMSASYIELLDIEDRIIFADLTTDEYDELAAAITIRKVETKNEH